MYRWLLLLGLLPIHECEAKWVYVQVGGQWIQVEEPSTSGNTRQPAPEQDSDDAVPQLPSDDLNSNDQAEEVE